MHGCMCSGMDVCIYSLGEEAEEERKVIGPQGIPVQGANRAGKSAMRHIFSDICHGDFHLLS